MFETYRMLGREREKELESEAARLRPLAGRPISRIWILVVAAIVAAFAFATTVARAEVWPAGRIAVRAPCSCGGLVACDLHRLERARRGVGDRAAQPHRVSRTAPRLRHALTWISSRHPGNNWAMHKNPRPAGRCSPIAPRLLV
jgi:hypothetical protein